MTLTNAQISRIRELYSKGYSKTDIAKKIGCSRKTVIEYLKGEFKPKKAKEKIEELEEELETLKKQIKIFESTMSVANKRITKLERMPITNLYDDFVCNHCGSRHLIAIKYKCTRCGKEGWWGYHPK